MPVLKSEHAVAAARDAVVLDMSDLRRQAARIIVRARMDAKEIVETAQNKKDQISTKAHDEAYKIGQAEGFSNGLAEGREQGRMEAIEQHSQQLAQLEEAWIAAAESWEQQRQQIERETQKEVFEFAWSLGKKVIHRIVELDQSVIVDQLCMALDQVLRPMDVTVEINPEDRAVVEQALPNLKHRFSKLEHVRLIEDDQITRGGCIVRHGQGHVDATLQTQLQRIAELVKPCKHETVASITPLAMARNSDEVSVPSSSEARDQ